MTLIKQVKRAFKNLQRATTSATAAGALKMRLNDLVAEIERTTAEHQDAERARAIRVSADRITVRDNLGSYASKTDGELAVRMIKRLRTKAG